MIKWIGYRKEIQKLTFWALTLSSERIEAFVGCVWFIEREMELRYWLVHGNVKKNQNKLVEWKAYVDIERIKSGDLKINFLF